MSAGTMVFSAFELLAGSLVMAGWQVRWIASLLALFVLIDAFLVHRSGPSRSPNVTANCFTF